MRIVVTGGTGSLGRALLAQVAKEVGVVGVMFSRDEFKQAQVMEALGHPPNVRACLGDVRDPDRLRVAFRGADAVVHAAALKRVDAVADHADELMKTNIVGTFNVIRAAMDCGVSRVLVISSDKAVLPTNAYGASKQMAEHIAVGMNGYSVPAGTRIAALRYGNVLGSRGSVVHVWRRAHRAGLPLPITRHDCTRFIITMDQALSCIRKAVATMVGGEIFVPDLPWCDIVDIGTCVAGADARFEVVGLRPGGEKLAEQLLTDEERTRCGLYETMYVIRPHVVTWETGRVLEKYPVVQDIPVYISGIPQRRQITVAGLAALMASVPEE